MTRSRDIQQTQNQLVNYTRTHTDCKKYRVGVNLLNFRKEYIRQKKQSANTKNPTGQLLCPTTRKLRLKFFYATSGIDKALLAGKGGMRVHSYVTNDQRIVDPV